MDEASVHSFVVNNYFVLLITNPFSLSLNEEKKFEGRTKNEERWEIIYFDHINEESIDFSL